MRLAGLRPHNHAIAAEIVALPDMMRGYEHIKLDHVERHGASLDDVERRFTASEC